MTKPEKAAVAAKPEKAPKDEKNGIARPKAGTVTARIWDIADKLSKEEGAPVARRKVLEAAMAEDINTATAATQYGRWRVYHGLGSEPKAPKAVPTPKAAKIKKSKEADVSTEDAA